MTPKERAAMQQVICKINQVTAFDETGDELLFEAQEILREALDHSGEANEMVIGWDRVKPEAIASDPLYQQGFVDGVEEGRNQVAEQAEQEPVAKYSDIVSDGGLDPRNAAPQPMQEPVAWMRLNEKNKCEAIEYIGDVDEHLYLPPSCQWLYAAPVRTKNLTDDEIKAIDDANWENDHKIWDIKKFARAVIQEFRRKNGIV